LFPDGQPACAGEAPRGQADLLKQGFGSPASLGSAPAPAVPGGQEQVVNNRQRAEQLKGLKDEPEVLAPKHVGCRGAQLVDPHPRHRDGAGVGPQQTGQ